MKKTASLLTLFIAAFLGASAQKMLTLNDALQTGLKNNYDIKILRNQAQISKNNDNYGTAGFLPLLETDGSANQSIQHLYQVYSTGTDLSRDNVKTTTYTGGVELDWTIFNGFLMFANKSVLNSLDQVGQLNYKNQVEISSDSIITGYYNIVRLQQLIKLQKQSIKISRIKLDISKTKYEIGSASKLDYLQSEVDLNADSTTLLKEYTSLKKAKASLNYYIGTKDTTDYTVADTILLSPVGNLADLQNLAVNQNPQILALNAQKNASSAAIDQARSAMYPTLTLGTRYNLNDVQAQAGLILVNQAVGLNYGATARWNLYNGGTVRTNIANAKLSEDNANQAYLEAVQSLNTSLAQLYADYLANNDLVTLVKDNLKFAVENLDIATESYKIGKINIVDYRTAQLGYVNAYTSLFTAIYTAKASEVALNRFSGQISKEAQ